MKKIIKVSSALVFFALASGSQAGDFNYTYIEGGMNHYDIDEIDHSIEINGSIALNDRVHLFAGYNQTDFKFQGYRYSGEITIDQQQIGIGTHFSSSQNTDLLVEAGILRLDAPGYGASETGFLLSSGVRHKINDKLEGTAGIKHMYLNEDTSETSANVGGRLYFNESLSAGLTYSVVEGESLFRSSIRLGTL